VLPAGDPRVTVRAAQIGAPWHGNVERIGEIGEPVVAADLADIAKLTGWRPDGWAEGEADLERFVLARRRHS